MRQTSARIEIEIIQEFVLDDKPTTKLSVLCIYLGECAVQRNERATSIITVRGCLRTLLLDIKSRVNRELLEILS